MIFHILLFKTLFLIPSFLILNFTVVSLTSKTSIKADLSPKRQILFTIIWIFPICGALELRKLPNRKSSHRGFAPTNTSLGMITFSLPSISETSNFCFVNMCFLATLSHDRLTFWLSDDGFVEETS